MTKNKLQNVALAAFALLMSGAGDSYAQCVIAIDESDCIHKAYTDEKSPLDKYDEAYCEGLHRTVIDGHCGHWEDKQNPYDGEDGVCRPQCSH
jgi:hypothetical protein